MGYFVVNIPSNLMKKGMKRGLWIYIRDLGGFTLVLRV